MRMVHRLGSWSPWGARHRPDRPDGGGSAPAPAPRQRGGHDGGPGRVPVRDDPHRREPLPHEANELGMLAEGNQGMRASRIDLIERRAGRSLRSRAPIPPRPSPPSRRRAALDRQRRRARRALDTSLEPVPSREDHVGRERLHAWPSRYRRAVIAGGRPARPGARLASVDALPSSGPIPAHVLRFWRALDAMLGSVQLTSWGAIVTDERYPAVWDANYARVDDGCDVDDRRGRTDAAPGPAGRRRNDRASGVVPSRTLRRSPGRPPRTAAIRSPGTW